MYDPLVVDTFFSAYSSIEPKASAAGESARGLTADADFGHLAATPLREIRNTAAQTAMLVALERNLEGARTTQDAFAIAYQCLRQLTPASICALYQHIPDSDVLKCTDAVGYSGHLLLGLTIKTGERISGWAFANDKTISNSKATLDLGEMSELFSPPLRSALSTPLKSGPRAIGTLTAYATRDNSFSDEHRYAFERLTHILGTRLGKAITKTSTHSIVRFPTMEVR
jgi:GAF domain-containing protein